MFFDKLDQHLDTIYNQLCKNKKRHLIKYLNQREIHGKTSLTIFYRLIFDQRVIRFCLIFCLNHYSKSNVENFPIVSIETSESNVEKFPIVSIETLYNNQNIILDPYDKQNNKSIVDPTIEGYWIEYFDNISVNGLYNKFTGNIDSSFVLFDLSEYLANSNFYFTPENFSLMEKMISMLGLNWLDCQNLIIRMIINLPVFNEFVDTTYFQRTLQEQGKEVILDIIRRKDNELRMLCENFLNNEN